MKALLERTLAKTSWFECAADEATPTDDGGTAAVGEADSREPACLAERDNKWIWNM